MTPPMKRARQSASPPALIRGRAWLFGDDIDTDQIYPGKYLPLTDKSEMARHAMEGTERGAEFLKSVKPGDILVAGRNFGCGSSREHAAIAIHGAGISVVIAVSLARIFHRNCVNTALPALESAGARKIHDGDMLEIDIARGEIKNETQGMVLKTEPMPELEREIISVGGLLKYLKSKGDMGIRGSGDQGVRK
ncbi:MAG TPA: 3-isopropylmalate dehydratase small subunit [bacterium]